MSGRSHSVGLGGSTYLPCVSPSFVPNHVAPMDLRNFQARTICDCLHGFPPLCIRISGSIQPNACGTCTGSSIIRLACSGKEMPLTSVLRRLASGQEVNQYISRLTEVWGVQDPEAYFRDICTLHLPVHAEMQLLNFYDNNPRRRPSFRFIGVSKKSCFLCQWFLARHPLSFSVSSCHQKLYLNWRPPPAADIAVYRQYKTIVTDLSKAMESVAKQELQNRLGLRRPVPPDSTAGVSVSGLKDFNRASKDMTAVTDLVTTSARSVARGAACTIASFQPIPVVRPSSPDEEEMSWVLLITTFLPVIHSQPQRWCSM